MHMIQETLEAIRTLAKDMSEVRIMEVCGGHTNTIMKYGIREVIPSTIKLISGPGCPVCVTSQHDIDCMIELALHGIKVASYGDMLNVPGTKMSLRDAQARGADIKMLYSIDQLWEERDRVFFAVGFETTMPMTAHALRQGIKVYSAHKLTKPIMRYLTYNMHVDGFIDPGHVSTIIGSRELEEMELPVPQVISGFKPEQVIRAILLLLHLIRKKEKTVVNDYPEVVLPEGNLLARGLIDATMMSVDVEWRGIGILPRSGLRPIDPLLDAQIIYREILKDVKSRENTECRCGEIVRGLIEPQECALFGKQCTPDDPKGACMVSETEGACAIAYKYGKSLGG